MKSLESNDFTYRVTGQILPKMTSKEFSIFIIFPDTYTCFHVVQQV